MVVHSSLNSQLDFCKADVKILFKIEFINNGGYWAKIYNCHTLEEAKERFFEDYPQGEYKRSKKRLKINRKKFW